MYKLTILFFFLTAFSSQSLTTSYQLKFENEDATYILQIKEGDLVFENQPNVVVLVHGDSASDTDNPSADTESFGSTQGKIYKITKGATWQTGLKIGGSDEIDAFKEIGGDDEIDAFKEIGANDEIDAFKEIGGSDDIDAFRDHQSYEVILSYEFVIIIDKSNKEKIAIPIGDGGLFIYIKENKFKLFK